MTRILKRYILLTAALVLTGVMGTPLARDYPAHADETAGNEKVVEVRIFNVAFEPKTITVEPGTTVRWVNRDPIDHDVTSGTAIAGRRARQLDKTKFPDGKFQSGVFGKDGAYEHTFTEKGTHRYYCNIHPIMQATVIVE